MKLHGKKNSQTSLFERGHSYDAQQLYSFTKQLNTTVQQFNFINKLITFQFHCESQQTWFHDRPLLLYVPYTSITYNFNSIVLFTRICNCTLWMVFNCIRNENKIINNERQNKNNFPTQKCHAIFALYKFSLQILECLQNITTIMLFIYHFFYRLKFVRMFFYDFESEPFL